MDAAKIVEAYERSGCRIAANGDVINAAGKVIDHLTVEAAVGIQEKLHAVKAVREMGHRRANSCR